MNPMALIMLGIFMPVPLALAFLLPLYLGIYASVLVIYTEQTDALLDAFTNALYIVNVFEHAASYWLNHLESVNHFTYSAPLIILPMLGLMVSVLCTVKLGKFGASLAY